MRGAQSRQTHDPDAGVFHVGTGFGDFLVCKFLRRATVGRRGGKDEAMSANGTPQISKRSRAGDRQTAHVGRSAFMLTREGKVFERGGGMLLG